MNTDNYKYLKKNIHYIMGASNSKIIPENSSKCIVYLNDFSYNNLDYYCNICNIKIHDSCRSYYLSHILEFPQCKHS